MSPGQRIAVLTRRLSLEAQSRAILATCSAGAMWSADGPVFTATAGTTIANIGDAVARMNDIGPFARNVTQSTVGNRPPLQRAGSFYYLDFNGTTSTLATAAAIGLNGPGMYLAAALMPTKAVGSSEFSMSNARYCLGRSLGNQGRFSTVAVQGYDEPNVYAQNTAVVHGAYFDSTFGVLHRKNGVDGTLITGAVDGGTSEGVFVLGQLSGIFFQGRFYASFSAKRATAFTPSEKLTIDRWLASKNGVTI